jgi:hypothetical protein
VKIDCSRCEMYQSGHCDDCLVSVLLHPPTEDAEIEDELASPLRTLAGAGLIPTLRFRPRRDRGPAGEAASGDPPAAGTG